MRCTALKEERCLWPVRLLAPRCTSLASCQPIEAMLAVSRGRPRFGGKATTANRRAESGHCSSGGGRGGNLSIERGRKRCANGKPTPVGSLEVGGGEVSLTSQTPEAMRAEKKMKEGGRETDGKRKGPKLEGEGAREMGLNGVRASDVEGGNARPTWPTWPTWYSGAGTPYTWQLKLS